MPVGEVEKLKARSRKPGKHAQTPRTCRVIWLFFFPPPLEESAPPCAHPAHPPSPPLALSHQVMKLAFSNAKTEEVGTFTVRLPKDQTVGDALEELRKQLVADPAKPLLSGAGAELRLFEIFNCRIYKVFDHKERVDQISDGYWHLRAEEARPSAGSSLAAPTDARPRASSLRVLRVVHGGFAVCALRSGTRKK